MCQEAICTKTAFELVNLFGNVHVNIPTVRNHAIRQRPDIIYFTRKRVITMPSVRKRTFFFKSIRKSISQEAISTKTCFHPANLYERIFIRRPAVRKHATRHRSIR